LFHHNKLDMARTKATASKKTTSRRAAAAAKPKAGVEKPKAPRKKRRFRPGTVALREIRKMQKSTNTLLAKSSFSRLAREIAMEYTYDKRWTKEALQALQEAAEAFLVDHFEKVNLVAIHSKRTTIMQKDSQIVSRLGKDMNIKSYQTTTVAVEEQRPEPMDRPFTIPVSAGKKPRVAAIEPPQEDQEEGATDDNDDDASAGGLF